MKEQMINSDFSMLKLMYLSNIIWRNVINSRIYGSEAQETGLTGDMNLGAICLKMVIKLCDCLESVQNYDGG